MADNSLTREEFHAHVAPMREDIAEMVRLQRDANGRLAKAETRLAVLEDRSIRVSVISGGVVAGVITAVVKLMEVVGR